MKMIDIVIPLGTGSKWHNNELRYSLRSLEKFGRNIGMVFIVGICPEFLKYATIRNYDLGGFDIVEEGVGYIPCQDVCGHERNIHEKIKLACQDERISENFLLWDDDFFLTEETDLENYPYYHQTSLGDRISTYAIKNNGYCISLRNTEDFLRINNRPTIDFNLHRPIIYNKQKYLDVMEKADWAIGNGYAIESLYCNYYEIPFTNETLTTDLKFLDEVSMEEINKQLTGRHIFSISDRALFPPMIAYLKMNYFEKSRWEK